MDKTVYLVRHCRTTGQEADAPLTDEGREQAGLLAEWMSRLPIGRIVSSPYARARESVRPLAERSGLPVETDDRLIERVLSPIPLPDWREQLARSFVELDRCLPGGESSRAAMGRGVAALRDALQHPAAVTVLVTHGNLLALLLKHFEDTVGYADWERLGNPDVYRVRYMGDTPPHVERATPDI